MNDLTKPKNTTATVVKSEFLTDVLAGLSKPDQKTLSPRWLYDQKGSKIFEQITDLPEYYVTRTELTLLKDIAPLFSDAIGSNATIVEYGAGAAVKVRLLLDALETPAQYVAIDISYDHLVQALKPVAAAYPDLDVLPVAGDFLSGTIATEIKAVGTKVGFFPGSTIGNLSDTEIKHFLDGARQFLGDKAKFVLGADLKKDPNILVPAYDDAAGVTAAFNLNLLTRINRELLATFDLSDFAHKAIWSEENSRIEMHLESLVDQDFSIAGQTFFMQAGETIHTENSRKFTRAQLEDIVAKSGWRIDLFETDAKGYFAELLLSAV